ncbi:hypothetical protein [Undibacterium sp. TC9W]|uniref:hypothetical protein n=1 Tax=Undibacterium sp. TC9W TaxID=3413053 RepID=UPI003BEF94C0
MEIYLVKVMRLGVELKKSMWFDRYNRPPFGKLEIGDSSDQGMHRNSIRAYFIPDKQMVSSQYLLDCHILWMHQKRFMLTGFEMVQTIDGPARYAQSWLCMQEEPPPLPEGR